MANPKKPGRKRGKGRFDHRRRAVVVHADETGWRIGTLNAWLWVFTNQDTTVYLIRSGEGARNSRSTWGGGRLALPQATVRPPRWGWEARRPTGTTQWCGRSYVAPHTGGGM